MDYKGLKIDVTAEWVMHEGVVSATLVVAGGGATDLEASLG